MCNVSIYSRYKMTDVPLTLWRHEVVQPKLTVDLFEAKMNGIVVKLRLGDTGRRDCGRQSRDLCFRFTPSATPLTRSIGID